MPSATILRIDNILIVTLQDDATSRDADDLLTQIGDAVVAHAACGVLIDVSPLSMVDSYVARSLGSMVVMSRLLGAEAVLAGMRPEVAIAMVELGTDLPHVASALNVDFAMATLRQRAACQV
jgi:rsbT antagonist protein RsbS